MPTEIIQAPQLLPKVLLQGRRRDYDIDYLLSSGTHATTTSGAERQLLCWVIPPWQRAEVWTDHQKQRFIEGVFLGLGTGYYVVNQPDWDSNGTLPMSGWLIDGQQRLTAIRDFVAGGVSIFDGIRYEDLSKADRLKRFAHVVFPCFEIEYQADESQLRELYDRLNFGGTSHTEADRAHFLRTPEISDLQANSRVERPAAG